MIKITDEEIFIFLDKIKEEPITIEDCANFLNARIESIKTIIKRNKNNFINDNMIILKGELLKKYKYEHENIDKRTPQISLLNYKNIIRIVFALTDNEIANNIKTFISKTDNDIFIEMIKYTNTSFIKKYEKEMWDVLIKLFGKTHKINKQIQCGRYKIDFVIDDYLAIECDEDGHIYYNASNEYKRQLYIESKGYTLLRYNTKEDDLLEFMGEIIHILENKNNVNVV